MGLFGPIRQLFGGRADARVARGESEDLFRALAEYSSDMICRIGPERPIYFSPACEILFGWTPDEMLQRRADEFFFPEDMPILEEATARLHSGESQIEVCRVRATRKDGSVAWVETNARLARATGKHAADLIVIVRDITDLKRREDELAQLARTDALTGLANRRVFDEALEAGWQDALVHGGWMSLLFVDIDRFKRFNDHFGHQAGDECLRSVAAALRGAITAAGSTTARFGGEEFAVILPGAEPAPALTAAEAIRKAVLDLAVHHPHGEEPARIVTVSVGAATALARPGDGAATAADLLHRADMALYRAKHLGRNRVETSLLLSAADNNPAAGAL